MWIREGAEGFAILRTRKGNVGRINADFNPPSYAIAATDNLSDFIDHL